MLVRIWFTSMIFFTLQPYMDGAALLSLLVVLAWEISAEPAAFIDAKILYLARLLK